MANNTTDRTDRIIVSLMPCLRSGWSTCWPLNFAYNARVVVTCHLAKPVNSRINAGISMTPCGNRPAIVYKGPFVTLTNDATAPIKIALNNSSYPNWKAPTKGIQTQRRMGFQKWPMLFRKMNRYSPLVYGGGIAM